MEPYIPININSSVYKTKNLNIENLENKRKDGKISYSLNTWGNNLHIIIQKQLSNNNNINNNNNNNNNNQPSLNVNINCNNISEKKLSRNEKKKCLIWKVLIKEKI